MKRKLIEFKGRRVDTKAWVRGSLYEAPNGMCFIITEFKDESELFYRSNPIEVIPETIKVCHPKGVVGILKFLYNRT